MVISNQKIVIVGSGISGLAAAERLVKAGFQHVRILEATKRSGGRIKTSTLGMSSFSITFTCILSGFFFLPFVSPDFSFLLRNVFFFFFFLKSA